MSDDRSSQLHDALSAAFDKVEDESSASDTPRVEPEAGEEAGQTETAEQRARDEQGRFAKSGQTDGKDKSRQTLTLKGKPDAAKEQERQTPGKDPAAQVVAKAPGQSAANADSDANRATQSGNNAAGDQREPIQPPQHWNGRSKVEWERLPHHVKETLSQEYQSVAELRNLNQVLDPLKQRFTQEFGGTDRALHSILSYWQFARQNPVDFIRDFVQQARIDPQSLFGGASEAQQAGQLAESADPTVTALQQELAAIRGQLQQVAQQPLIAQQNQIQAEVTNFGGAVENGKLAHPYFNDVRPVMAALMQSGQASNLKEAYDMACYANPQIRQSLLTAEAERQAAERRKAADNARNTAASVTGAPGPRGPGKPQNETVGQTLQRAWEQAESGGRA